MIPKKTDVMKIAREDARQGGISTVKWIDDTGPETIAHMRMYMFTEEHFLALYHMANKSGKQKIVLPHMKFNGRRNGETVWYVVENGETKFGHTETYKDGKLIGSEKNIDQTLVKRRLALFERRFELTRKPAIILENGAHSGPVKELQDLPVYGLSAYSMSKPVLNRFKDENEKVFTIPSEREDSITTQTFLRPDNQRLLQIWRLYKKESQGLSLEAVTIREHDPDTGYRDGVECSFQKTDSPRPADRLSQDIITPRSPAFADAFPPNPYGNRHEFRQGIVTALVSGVDYQFAEQALRLEQQVMQNQRFDYAVSMFRDSVPQQAPDKPDSPAATPLSPL